MVFGSKRHRHYDISYSSKCTMDLTDEEIKECSTLFSSFYGKYSKQSEKRPGEQIYLPPSYYKKHYCKPDFYVALARDKENLVGQAFYIRKAYEKNKMMTWVLQLVVDVNYRKQGIASTLLRSIWGFSDDYAWGLATANPCTVRTLESATFRKCKPTVIKKKLKDIKQIGNDTTFVKPDAYIVTNSTSQVNTNFHIDNSEFITDTNSCDKYLGKLKPGCEWLAFTFQEQDIQIQKYKKHFDDIVMFSEKILKEAYSRMDVENHTWAKGTPNEVDFIEHYFKKGTVLDLGCGVGRHSIELSKRGYRVTGIDFSQKHIECATRNAQDCLDKDAMPSFICEDVRTYTSEEKYDNVICLFDVVGSFPDDRDNKQIIKTAYQSLKKNGHFIISVMNMELTNAIVPNERKRNLKEHPEILLKLPPSNTMQSSGNIFISDYLAIDTRTKLVYRKEQFVNDSSLSAEYVIRDKRFYMYELVELLESYGFEIVEKRYVRAGHFDEKLEPLDGHAKEICIVAKKTK